MADFYQNQSPKRLNQFKNRNNINISDDMLTVVLDATNMISNVTSSIQELSKSNLQISQSVTNISGSVITHNEQIGNLKATTRSMGSNKLFSNKEIPFGEINGINTTYVLSNEPILGSDHIYLNGVLIEDKDNDYFISGSFITFSNPLQSGMKLRCTYYYQDSNPVRVFVDKEQPNGIINGNNITFTLISIPVEGSEHIYLNGVLQEIGGDYNISDSTITFITPPLPNSKIRCTYYYFL